MSGLILPNGVETTPRTNRKARKAADAMRRAAGLARPEPATPVPITHVQKPPELQCGFNAQNVVIAVVLNGQVIPFFFDEAEGSKFAAGIVQAVAQMKALQAQQAEQAKAAEHLLAEAQDNVESGQAGKTDPQFTQPIVADAVTDSPAD